MRVDIFANMSISYLITPLLVWLCAGSLKFFVNCWKARCLAVDLIGYGGFPSNHSAIVSSMATLIALREGFQNPAFGVAITLAFIVILDANALRRQIGKQAVIINQLVEMSGNVYSQRLRERMGHTMFEIVGGVCVGVAVAMIVWRFF